MHGQRITRTAILAQKKTLVEGWNAALVEEAKPDDYQRITSLARLLIGCRLPT